MKSANVNLIGIGKGLWLVLVSLLISLQVACSTRGVAPVYDRAATQAQARSADSYTVRRGDTLYSIAWRYRLNYHQLGAWNRIKGPEYTIYPGQRLRLKPPTYNKRPVQRPPEKPATALTAVSRPPAVPEVRKSPPSSISHPERTTISLPKKEALQKLKLDWRWPTIGRVVQTFSANDPERKGVRISGVSDQPVLAAEAGRVVYSGSGLVGYGNLVIIKHDNDYLSAYGYNKKLLVKEGDEVTRGQQIAHMGSPRNGAGSMLHFEIRKQGRPIDPLPLLPRL